MLLLQPRTVGIHNVISLSLSLFFFALIVSYAHDQMYYANAVILTEVFFVLDMSKSINLNELIVEQDY